MSEFEDNYELVDAETNYQGIVKAVEFVYDGDDHLLEKAGTEEKAFGDDEVVYEPDSVNDDISVVESRAQDPDVVAERFVEKVYDLEAGDEWEMEGLETPEI